MMECNGCYDNVKFLAHDSLAHSLYSQERRRVRARETQRPSL